MATEELAPNESAGWDFRRALPIVVCAVLVAMVWSVFGKTVHYEFVDYDDDRYVYNNPNILRGFSFRGVAWAFTHVHSDNWHPVTTMSHMVDCLLFGSRPAGHHFVNVLLHSVAAVLLFLAIRQLTGAFWRAALVAAIFAIHPLRVESVAWISERKDVLSGVFFMMTLWAYARYARGKGRSQRDYFISLGSLAMGLLCKPTLVTVPFVLLLLDYWPLDRLTNGPNPKKWLIANRVTLLEKIPFFTLSAVSCFATIVAQKEALTWSIKLSLLHRIANAFASYAVYLRQTIWPFGLTAFYPYPEGKAAMVGAFLSMGLLLFISAIVFYQRKKCPAVIVGWLWFLGMLVPMLGIVQVGTQAHADRYSYLPQIGILIAVIWAGFDFASGMKHGRELFVGVTVALIGSLMLRASNQAVFWRNSEALWTRALSTTSGNYVAHNNLGYVLLKEGKIDEAILHFRAAIEIEPGYVVAGNDLGYALLQKGETMRAMSYFRKVIAIKPDFAEAYNNLGNAAKRNGQTTQAITYLLKALELNPTFAEAQSNLGNIYLDRGKVDEAVASYRKAIDLNPFLPEPYNNLGNALSQQGNLKEAIKCYQRAVGLRADYAEAHNNMAGAFVQLHQTDDAIRHYRTAIKARPNYSDPYNHLGELFAGSKRIGDAVKVYSALVQAEPQDAAAHFHLAVVLVKADRVDDAITNYREAIRLDPEAIPPRNNLAWLLSTFPNPKYRDGAEALRLAQQVYNESKPPDPLNVDTLAAACAETGDFESASARAAEAINLARWAGNEQLAAEIQTRLDLYDRHISYRQTGK